MLLSFILSSCNYKTDAAYPSNKAVINDSFIADDEEYIYISKDDHIYAVNKAANGAVDTGVKGNHLFYYKKYLYYQDKNNFYKIKAAGLVKENYKSIKAIFEKDVVISEYTIIKDRIYYDTYYQQYLSSSDLDGKNARHDINNKFVIGCDDKYIYMTDRIENGRHYIYRADDKNNGEYLFYIDILDVEVRFNHNYFFIMNDYLYYAGENEKKSCVIRYYLAPDSSREIFYSSDDGSYINIINVTSKYIYFFFADDHTALYTLSRGGDLIKRGDLLNDDHYFYIDSYKERIYLIDPGALKIKSFWDFQ